METLVIAILAAAYLAFFVLALRRAPDTWYILSGKEEELASYGWYGLRGKEEELASYGLTWETNSAHERTLAAEHRVARRRRAGQPAASGALRPSIRPSAEGMPRHV